jgi:hypothetical protein
MAKLMSAINQVTHSLLWDPFIQAEQQPANHFGSDGVAGSVRTNSIVWSIR